MTTVVAAGIERTCERPPTVGTIRFVPEGWPRLGPAPNLGPDLRGGKEWRRIAPAEATVRLRNALLTVLLPTVFLACAPRDGVGLEPGPLDALAERVRDGSYPEVHAILLMKDGRLAFERYFPGNAWDYGAPEFRGPWTDHNAETPHNLASVTKSITGLLVVLAVDRGMIRGFDEPLCGFFPEHAALCDGEKAAIHLGHVLTMTSGLAWNEQDVPYSDPSNDIVRLFLVEDPVAHVLSKPVVAPPASRWSYNGGGTNLLGKVVERASGMRLDAFARVHLFEPLGIRDATWQFVRPDFVYASGDMTMRPRDMAKIGQMLLDGGVWEGKRILSEEKAALLVRTQVPLMPGTGYALHWWTRTFESGGERVDAFAADGWGGQRILVFPSKDLVAVFTGGSYTKQHRLDEVVTEYVLPAVRR